MSKLKWDETGKRTYEVGVSQGVLYIPNAQGEYATGVAWNGLTTVTESPSGAESSKQYADNIVYLNLVSAEEFGATLEAFTYPDEFAQFDGWAQPLPGVYVSQQTRKPFGLSYKTQIGNDLEGVDFGYKLHLAYGCLAAPTEKAYATINDSPEAQTLSWELTTSPTMVPDLKPSALMVIDSTKADSDALAELEQILYGTDATTNPVDPGTVARLPLPAEVLEILGDVTP